MWPKLLAQLFELLPHITRLVPMADRYFSSKAANEKANEAALAAMAEGVRGDLGQVTKAHVGLYRQLQELSAQVSEVESELKSARAAADQAGNRTSTLEAKVAAVAVWVQAGVSVVVVMLGVVIYLLVRGH
jgi:chromosome segregation ATPase